MTQTFTSNTNNDLFIGSDGKLSISSGIDAVLNACRTAALAQRGEMIFATNKGIPNFDVTFSGAPNLALFEAFLRANLEAVDSVVEVEDLSTSNENNVLSYSATIKTLYGTGSLNG